MNLRRGTNRLGIVVGFVAAVGLFVSWIGDKSSGVPVWFTLAICGVVGMIVWLVIRGLGWTIEGFRQGP